MHHPGLRKDKSQELRGIYQFEKRDLRSFLQIQVHITTLTAWMHALHICVAPENEANRIADKNSLQG